MKYKVGDKVRIIIKDYYCEETKDKIKNMMDRATKIKSMTGEHLLDWPYMLEDFPRIFWKEDELEPVPEPTYTPIYSRFEILDL